MRNLVISSSIARKLADKHHIRRCEVVQCFQNKCGVYLEDTREDHESDPPTPWFVAPTNTGRGLKIAFIHRGGKVFLRSASDANDAA